MVGQIIQLLVVLALIGLFAWLATRAWRSRRGLVKWPGAVLSGLLSLLLLAVVVVAGFGFYRIHKTYDNPVSNVAVAGTPDQIAQGERLAHLCQGCHSAAQSLPLSGGDENFGGPFGTLYSPNLTPAGRLSERTDGELLRAIREGISKDGHTLIVMPSRHLHHMSDEDAQALVAYLRSQPAVERDSPTTNLNLLGMLLIGAGLFPTSAQAPITQPVAAPPAGVTPAYGEYLTSFAGCSECHGDDLTGGSGGFVPAGPDLRAVSQRWSESEFVRTIQTGTDPSGHVLDPDEMPWKDFNEAFTEEQLRAIYAYLRNLPVTSQVGR